MNLVTELIDKLYLHCGWIMPRTCSMKKKEYAATDVLGAENISAETPATYPPFPWGEEVCSYVAANGSLDVLKWARKQDSPFFAVGMPMWSTMPQAWIVKKVPS